MNESPLNLYDLTPSDLEALMRDWSEPVYRARQIFRHLYVRLVQDIDEMTDLSQAFRRRLRNEAQIGNLDFTAMQTGDEGMTRKALFTLPSGETVESVLMVYPDRATVCVSSQAGCPMGCVFCATARLGFLRDLSSGQMIEQVLWAARELNKIASNSEQERQGASGSRPAGGVPGKLTNVVYMGMGEPFNNYDNWWASVKRLHDPQGYNLGSRNFTVSTVGLPTGIRRLAGEDLQVNLAISLHAANDELRSALMPVNRAYPVQALLEATRAYVDQTGRRVSFEYVLLEGKNDDPDQARELVRVLKDGPMGDCPHLLHVNLIPWNPVPGAPLARSRRARALDFQRVLSANGVPCTIRVERGTEIAAACGQLAGEPNAPTTPPKNKPV